LPFLLEAYEDPTGGFCIDRRYDSCPLGPWALQLEPRDGGGFEGVLVAVDGSIAETLRLEPEGDHYRFVPATLAEYTYAWWVAPGVWVDDLTQLQLIDETGDCVADRVRLSGLASTVGLISSDYSSNDPETYPIDIEGESFESPRPALDPTTNDDPLHPLLRTPELLVTGSATLTDAQGQVIDAEPLTVGRFIYGFRALAALGADSHATWKLEGKDLAGRSRDREIAAELGAWPLITDGTFENDWPDSVAAELFRAAGDEGAVIHGGYSLVLPSGGDRASFRLTQPPGTKRLRFLASAKPVSDPDPRLPLDDAESGIVVEYAVPNGPVIGAALTATATSCADYPDFCNPDGDPNNPVGPGVFDFSLDVPESSESRQVLLRLFNHNYDYGVQAWPILVDELHFE
jgi:hypothetical protein